MHRWRGVICQPRRTSTWTWEIHVWCKSCTYGQTGLQPDSVISRQPSFDMTGLDATWDHQTNPLSLLSQFRTPRIGGTMIVALRPGRGWLLAHTCAVAPYSVRKTILQGTAENIYFLHDPSDWHQAREERERAKKKKKRYQMLDAGVIKKRWDSTIRVRSRLARLREPTTDRPFFPARGRKEPATLST